MARYIPLWLLVRGVMCVYRLMSLLVYSSVRYEVEYALIG
ncbi:hypothetical protein APHNP_0044 [Anaplasma phagocytophilum str. ApNP]|uniref:Uncharacterized protein n=2 Tax=Anaplasma phagocytophilum TaxID=948 RepID=A0A0F3NK81_ANAPH|nr:hypothetical protein APHMUC_0288 [Anaplasma phagocytophilum str. ApMUC09]KJV67314.1 hypothetical protein APHNP_0044 [Anaplasma phagocytophilum str. ApNP]